MQDDAKQDSIIALSSEQQLEEIKKKIENELNDWEHTEWEN